MNKKLVGYSLVYRDLLIANLVDSLEHCSRMGLRETCFKCITQELKICVRLVFISLAFPLTHTAQVSKMGKLKFES
jgi:hypothetical protein